MSKPTVFLSYSHKDELWKDRLIAHLAVLEQQGLLETWDDRRILVGADWHGEISRAMERATVALFLVSGRSLTSKFILDTEIRRLLERRAADGIHVLPVIVSSCTWKQVPWLAEMQVRPRDGKPLASFRGDQRDGELVKIAEEVLALLGANHRPRQPALRSPDEETRPPGSSFVPVEEPTLALTISPHEIHSRVAESRRQELIGQTWAGEVTAVTVPSNRETETVRLPCVPAGQRRAVGNVLLVDLKPSVELDRLRPRAVLTVEGRIKELPQGAIVLSPAEIVSVKSYGRG